MNNGVPREKNTTSMIDGQEFGLIVGVEAIVLRGSSIPALRITPVGRDQIEIETRRCIGRYWRGTGKCRR